MSDELIESLRSSTPARIAAGRAGTRPTTAAWLNFRLDHALARDAVNSELDEAFLTLLRTKYAAVQMQTLCNDRREFVLFPPRGKDATQQCLAGLKLRCRQNADVQIVINDGLSAKAVEENIPDLLAMLLAGLELEGITCGTLVVVKQGRVAIADKIAYATHAKLALNLIGERPGLTSALGLSAYLTYDPGPHTISSDRTVVSNIHPGGTPPVEAGAYLVHLCKRILALKLSGVKLQQLG
ncbi:MAG: ethanolamine ammonia-lyase subunit EutC [Candidatus Obscuribacterales bacterium]|nr:ethanolamine ammonia-lyase subunit EutC [Candidatus Obscuribacterales bacterium]